MMRPSHMRNHFRKVCREERFPEAGLGATGDGEKGYVL